MCEMKLACLPVAPDAVPPDPRKRLVDAEPGDGETHL